MEVLPELCIGSFGAANNREAVVANGITHVLCVSSSLPLPFVLSFNTLETNGALNQLTLSMAASLTYASTSDWASLTRCTCPSQPPSQQPSPSSTRECVAPMALSIRLLLCFLMRHVGSAIAGGGVVLVHCFLGRSRSATIVLAYLMARRQMRLADALSFLRAIRPQIEPNRGFVRQLEAYEQQLMEKLKE